MNKNFIWGIVVLVVFVLFWWIFGTSNTGVVIEPINPEEGATENVDFSSNKMLRGEVIDGVREFIIEGSNFAFSSSKMVVKKGETVRVIFRNIGGFHDFVIDEFNVATSQINIGEEEVIEFIADKEGSFEYYCSVANHRALGMVGVLIVE